jgi:multidrug efflux pump subunit AcrA (membrane-fusion protein)
MAEYPTFTAPTRKAMTLAQAQSQANSELGNLYARAIQSIQSQLRQNQALAAEQAAARGLSGSGLAQDAQNKLAIAAQSDIANTEADRTDKVAALARQILERDQDVGFRERQQAYNEWSGQQGLRMDVDRFNYQKQRDAVADSQWQQEFNLQKQRAARRSSGGSSRSSSAKPKSTFDVPKESLGPAGEVSYPKPNPGTAGYYTKMANLFYPEDFEQVLVEEAKDRYKSAFGKSW